MFTSKAVYLIIIHELCFQAFDEAMQLSKQREQGLLKISTSFHDYIISTPDPTPQPQYQPAFTEIGTWVTSQLM